MQHGNPYITQRDKTRKALLHPVRIPRGGTHILQKAYVTCHENMGGGEPNWLLSWMCGSQVFRKVGTLLMNNVFCVFKVLRTHHTFGQCLHLLRTRSVCPDEGNSCEGDAESLATCTFYLLGATEAATQYSIKGIQTLWNGRIHSLYKSIRVRRIIFQEGIGPEESKQERLSLKLREEDLKINIRMLWKDISQSSKLCRPTYASPCSQLLFLWYMPSLL